MFGSVLVQQQRMAEKPLLHDYGEQCADTDGLAAYRLCDIAPTSMVVPRDYVVAAVRATTDVAELSARVADRETRLATLEDVCAGLQARIARKEAANEALVQRVFAADAKHEATMADMRSLQRQAENWQAECKRLSALLIETQEQLAKRMAMPARALRFGGVR